MTAPSIGRLTMLGAALGAAAVAGYVFYITHPRQEAKVETAAAPSAPTTPAQPPSGGRDGLSTTTAASPAAAEGAAATARAGAVVADAAGALGTPAADASGLSLDVVRIEPTGDAVIAGRTAPGAVVDLLRNGERLDRVVADASGQFAMVPPTLPAGTYELTLSARSPDGTQATSKHGIAVALNDASSKPPTRSRPGDALAELPPQAAKRPVEPATAEPEATGAVTPAKAALSPAGVTPGVSTRVVSRGESLWRISRVTYGAGTQYVVIYKANRERIRNPDLIYPGQTIVVPPSAH